MTTKLLLLPGDGIGPEVMAVAADVLATLRDHFGFAVEWEEALIGGAAYEAVGHPFPQATQDLAIAADAVLLAAVGGPRYDALPRELRPERGLLGLRQLLGAFANLRPVVMLPKMELASSLKPELVLGLDLLIVRELTGGVYFGEPRGRRSTATGIAAFNTMIYSENEIERIARVAFSAARERRRQVCSVDKANVLETSELWREVVTRVALEFPDVHLTHQLVDNAAMQLVRTPKQFDVILTENLFGDILSDLASMLTGSIGLLPSASLDAAGKGLYEPIHGSAPDIAGQDLANPLAMILSLAMLCRYSCRRDDLGRHLEGAVEQTLSAGFRTKDIATAGSTILGTQAMGAQVVEYLRARAS